MPTITASDLKTKGITSIEEKLASESIAFITVRGEKKFVVMDINHYNYLRECELETALLETKSDINEGNVVAESAAEHIARISATL